jgi:hypothetical protein
MKKSELMKTDWASKLEKGEMAVFNDKTVVLLEGLRRLAREAGLVKSGCAFSHIAIGDMGVFQCIYTVEFDDGSIWVGAGDANAQSVSPPFDAYPTAVAESRAESRCLKKALGIAMLSAEEVGFSNNAGFEVKNTDKIDRSVVRAIEQKAERAGIELVQIIENAVKDSSRAQSIFMLDQLTCEEGTNALEYLNSL